MEVKIHRRRVFFLASLTAFVLSLWLLPAPGLLAAPFTQENKPENLKAYFELIYQTLYTKKDPKEAAALFRALIPDQERVQRALKDDAAPEIVHKILNVFQRLGIPGESDMPKILPEDKSAVAVFGATTEEIAAYQEGSTAFQYFSRGAKRVGEQILRPQMTFYQVRVTAPSKTSGLTYHLFYWDGGQWSMLGKPWQALK
jgi:hypothetical protein